MEGVRERYICQESCVGAKHEFHVACDDVSKTVIILLLVKDFTLESGFSWVKYSCRKARKHLLFVEI